MHLPRPPRPGKIVLFEQAGCLRRAPTSSPSCRIGDAKPDRHRLEYVFDWSSLEAGLVLLVLLRGDTIGLKRPSSPMGMSVARLPHVNSSPRYRMGGCRKIDQYQLALATVSAE